MAIWNCIFCVFQTHLRWNLAFSSFSAGKKRRYWQIIPLKLRSDTHNDNAKYLLIELKLIPLTAYGWIFHVKRTHNIVDWIVKQSAEDQVSTCNKLNFADMQCVIDLLKWDNVSLFSVFWMGKY